MERDGAVNAKAEIFADAFGFDEVPVAAEAGAEPVFAAAGGSEPFDAMHRARKTGRIDARDLIAVGALLPDPHRHRAGSKIGIFVQRPRLRHHPIVERARTIARGEVEVIVTGPIRRHSVARPGRHRPLEIGVSVGHHSVSAGTLGCFVKRRADGRIGILSNNHVLAHSNRGRPGDAILQPGRLDGGRSAENRDRVAELSTFVPLDFGVDAINYVDAAVATLVGDMACVSDRAHHAGTGWTVGDKDSLVFERQAVVKMGRTTGPTRGTIDGVNIDNLLVSYRFGQSFGIARFDRQISIVGEAGTFSKPGDSGSLVCSADGRSLALLFAGSERGGRSGHGLAFASPIESVLDALDIDLWLEA